MFILSNSEMTDQQNHLSQVLQQQKQLIEEMGQLNSKLDSKRELAIKLQGVIEYLKEVGVKLPEPESESLEESPVSPTEVVTD